jgi:hypothetical protein
MFVATFMATWFPGGRDWFYVLQPLSAVLFFADRLLRCRPTKECATRADAPACAQAA